MPNEFRDAPEHSAEWFGETRDDWWEVDSLCRHLRRWDVPRQASVLDVGSGVGHWGRLLMDCMAQLGNPVARLTGLDREARWVHEATKRAQRYPAEISYVCGDAARLPFFDASFDVTTCQTVLMHVASPRTVLAEMQRVTKPGGRVVLAEPNNATSVLLELTTLATPPRVASALLGFYWTCLDGKAALGEGDERIGEHLPHLLHEMGFEQIDVFNNERCSRMEPPYQTPPEQALVEEMASFASRDRWIWSKEQTQRYFAAGGGAVDDFADAWAEARGVTTSVAAALREKRFHCAGGGLFYLVSARKPL